jgi:hypothetical protein
MSCNCGKGRSTPPTGAGASAPDGASAPTAPGRISAAASAPQGRATPVARPGVSETTSAATESFTLGQGPGAASFGSRLERDAAERRLGRGRA